MNLRGGGFDPNFMSTPPPGSVYFGPGTTGGAPYTGGNYIPGPSYIDPFAPQLPMGGSYAPGNQGYSPPAGGSGSYGR
jgi:hypothetical protein